MKIYIAGPMTGLPEFNYPIFNKTAKALRDLGYTVMNPAENQTPPCGSWVGYMRTALSQVATADVMVLLRGWEDSSGATKEATVAQWLGISIVKESPHALAELAELSNKFITGTIQMQRAEDDKADELERLHTVELLYKKQQDDLATKLNHHSHAMAILQYRLQSEESLVKHYKAAAEYWQNLVSLPPPKH